MPLPMSVPTTPSVDGQQIRRVLLEVIQHYSQQGPGYFQSNPILDDAASRLSIRGNLPAEQALLTLFHDLFRLGQLAWGYDLSNTGPPFCHLTQQGRQTLQHLSRDPANPGGYLAHITNQLNPIANSYLSEGLNTYNSNCFKATAVMVGAAAESLVLELRDVLVTKMTSLGQTVPANLEDWRIKRVLDTIKRILDTKKTVMPNNLAEAYEAYWPAFTQQIRAVRNEAGHPSSVDPVTPESVHASLLIFPELANIAEQLRSWVSVHYT